MAKYCTIFVIMLISVSCLGQRYNKDKYRFNYKININEINVNGYYYSIYELNKDYHKEKGHFIKMRVFLNNGYTYLVKNGFGNECGDTISIDCAIKMSEFMLDKNINYFLKNTDKQTNANYHLENWGKYDIKNDTITIQWYYNHHGRYFLAEEKGVIKDSNSFKLIHFKDYQSKKDTISDEFYQFKQYPIKELYHKIPKKLLKLED